MFEDRTYCEGKRTELLRISIPQVYHYNPPSEASKQLSSIWGKPHIGRTLKKRDGVCAIQLRIHAQLRAKEHHFAPRNLQDPDDDTGRPKCPVPAPTASQPQQDKSECVNVEALTEGNCSSEIHIKTVNCSNTFKWHNCKHHKKNNRSRLAKCRQETGWCSLAGTKCPGPPTWTRCGGWPKWEKRYKDYIQIKQYQRPMKQMIHNNWLNWQCMPFDNNWFNWQYLIQTPLPLDSLTQLTQLTTCLPFWCQATSSCTSACRPLILCLVWSCSSKLLSIQSQTTMMISSSMHSNILILILINASKALACQLQRKPVLPHLLHRVTQVTT